MEKIIESIKKFFGRNNTESSAKVHLDTDSLIQVIRKLEIEHPIEPGRRIYNFEFLEFILNLDIEITGQYRLTAFLGQEKKYGFSIKCSRGNYKILEEGLKIASEYLNSDRKLTDLPDNEIIKGHFFG